MKQVVWIVVAALLLAGFTACGTKEGTPIPSEVIISSSEDSSVENNTEETPIPEEENSLALADPVMVADAAVYRGTVTQLIEGEDGPVLVLSLAEGTMYGPSPVEINVLEETRLNFNLGALTTGDYVEVYYTALYATDDVEMIDALAINFLGQASARVFNGTVKEITLSEENPKTGSFLMESLDGGNEVLFHFVDDGTTQFYMNFEDITEGTQLNIFLSGAVATSLPAQATALEIRPYYVEQ